MSRQINSVLIKENVLNCKLVPSKNNYIDLAKAKGAAPNKVIIYFEQ